VQSTEIADLRSLSQEGESSDVLQGLPSRYVRVPDRALLLRVLHGIRARMQTARHPAAALAKSHEVSDRLGPVNESSYNNQSRSSSTLIAYFVRRRVRSVEILSREQRERSHRTLYTSLYAFSEMYIYIYIYTHIYIYIYINLFSCSCDIRKMLSIHEKKRKSCNRLTNARFAL